MNKNNESIYFRLFSLQLSFMGLVLILFIGLDCLAQNRPPKQNKHKSSYQKKNDAPSPEDLLYYKEVTLKIKHYLNSKEIIDKKINNSEAFELTSAIKDSLKAEILNLNAKIKVQEDSRRPNKSVLNEYRGQLGRNYRILGDSRSALKVLLDLANDKSRNVKGLQELASIAKEREDYEALIIAYKGILAVNRTDLFTYWLLAEAYERVLWVEQAAVMYKKLLKMGTMNEMIYRKISKLYFDAGEYKRSLPFIRQAISYDTSNATNYYMAGLVYSNIRDIKRAIDHFEKAIHFNPDNSEAYYNIGLIYRYDGEEEKANYYLNKSREKSR